MPTAMPAKQQVTKQTQLNRHPHVRRVAVVLDVRPLLLHKFFGLTKRLGEKALNQRAHLLTSTNYCHRISIRKETITLVDSCRVAIKKGLSTAECGDQKHER